MFELKPLPRGAIDAALSKAERYRLLNEPWEAESICLDVLAVEPGHQQALVTLLLAITDQFGSGTGDLVTRARALLPKLQGDYAQAYYAGIICERRGRSILRARTPGSGPIVYDWLHQAMGHYADAMRRNPDAAEPVIRWNSCARTIERYGELKPAVEERGTQLLE